MQISPTQRVELRHYFEIKRDLISAVRNADSSAIEHHIDEFQVLAMHTTSYKLRRACLATVAEQGPLLPSAVHA